MYYETVLGVTRHLLEGVNYSTGSATSVGEPHPSESNALSGATKIEIARRYLAGERPVDLAREYGISEWRVQELRKRFGLAKHPIGMRNDEIDTAILLYSQGLSFNKIGARLGCDPKTVAKERRLRGIAP